MTALEDLIQSVGRGYHIHGSHEYWNKVAKAAVAEIDRLAASLATAEAARDEAEHDRDVAIEHQGRLERDRGEARAGRDALRDDLAEAHAQIRSLSEAAVKRDLSVAPPPDLAALAGRLREAARREERSNDFHPTTVSLLCREAAAALERPPARPIRRAKVLPRWASEPHDPILADWPGTGSPADGGVERPPARPAAIVRLRGNRFHVFGDVRQAREYYLDTIDSTDCHPVEEWTWHAADTPGAAEGDHA